MKKKVIFRFIFLIILLAISGALFGFFAESHLSTLVNAKNVGYFSYTDYKELLTLPIKQAISSFNYYSLIMILIPCVSGAAIVIMLLMMLVRRRGFAFISILLLLVVTALLFAITSGCYYVLFTKNNIEEIKTIITFKNFSSGDEDLLPKIINVAFLIGFLLFAAISVLYYISFVFTCIGESFKKKKSKNDKIIEYYAKNGNLEKIILDYNNMKTAPKSSNKVKFYPRGNKTSISTSSTGNYSNSTAVQYINNPKNK